MADEVAPDVGGTALGAMEEGDRALDALDARMIEMLPE